MAVALPALPEHPADLREYCLQLLTELNAQQQLIAKLSHELELFRRYVYGRRSEKLDPAPLLLEFAGWLKAMNGTVPAEGEGANDAPLNPLVPALALPRPGGHGRKPLPGFLPRQRVEHGLPEAQCTCRACGARLVKIGEETGELEKMLSKIADFYEDEVDASVQSLTSIVEPIMMIGVGIMVGVIIISMYMPMFKMLTLVK